MCVIISKSKKKAKIGNYIPRMQTIVIDDDILGSYNQDKFIKCKILTPKGSYCGGIIFIPREVWNKNHIIRNTYHESEYSHKGDTLLTKSFHKAFANDHGVIDLSYQE